MDWKDDEVNRRLNDGTHNFCNVMDVVEEGKRIRRDIDREERSRQLEEENNKILKIQLIEAQKANLKLEEQNNVLKDTNEKLKAQIADSQKEVANNKKRSNISIVIALASLIVAIVSVVLSITLK